MKYLEIPAVDTLNHLLQHLEATDQSRIYGRVEAYSCKNTGNDKKLYKQISDRLSSSPEKIHPNPWFLSPKQPSTILQPEHKLDNNTPTSPQKVLCFLIASLNQTFPDYNFNDLSMSSFVSFPRSNIPDIIRSVDTTLFNVGLANAAVASSFSQTLWTCLNEAIQLDDCCEVFSYLPDLDSDPFGEGAAGNIWSFNYIFWNKKLKRILIFYCRAMNQSCSMDDITSSRSLTPFNRQDLSTMYQLSISSQSWIDDCKSSRSQSPIPYE